MKTFISVFILLDTYVFMKIIENQKQLLVYLQLIKLVIF